MLHFGVMWWRGSQLVACAVYSVMHSLLLDSIGLRVGIIGVGIIGEVCGEWLNLEVSAPVDTRFSPVDTNRSRTVLIMG
jgi:hypothetical protein